MADHWVEWTVRYQVRRSRQDEAASGEKWAWTEMGPIDWGSGNPEQDVRRFAEDLNLSGGHNICNAQVIRKVCEVVET